jgi:hypothetical protein
MSADISGPLATPANVAAFLPAATTLNPPATDTQTVGTAPAGTSDADLILSLNPPATEQEKYDFTKDNGRPPNSPREFYDWIVSIRSKAGYNPATMGRIPSAAPGDGFSPQTLNPYDQLVPIVERLIDPLVSSVQQLKSGFLDPIITIVPGGVENVRKAGTKVATAVSAQYAQEGGAPMPVPGRAPVRAQIMPMTTTKPSVMQQITTHLSDIVSNSGSMNDNITTLNENMKALLDAFNAANRSKSEINFSNNSQEGGRRRQTKGKGRRKRRGATRR